jgi:nucleoside phosphorylase
VVELDGGQGLALSVAEASGSPAEAAARAAAHPAALVEEMEGYAVALAATIMSVPCSMVRGISNLFASSAMRIRWRLTIVWEMFKCRPISRVFMPSERQNST